MGRLIVALSIITVLRLGLLAGRARDGPIRMTAQELPFVVPELAFEGTLKGGAPGETCALIVFFQPECPYCGQAADLERGGRGNAAHWVADSRLDASAFGDQIHMTSSVHWSAQLWADFAVQGVPAAFVVTGRRVIDAWRYQGSETAGDIEDRCRQ